MDKSTLLHLLRTLQTSGPLRRTTGICHNIALLAVRQNPLTDTTPKSVIDSLAPYIDTWPKRGPNRLWPIPDELEDQESECMWSNTPARHELLAHCIKELENELVK